MTSGGRNLLPGLLRGGEALKQSNSYVVTGTFSESGVPCSGSTSRPINRRVDQSSWAEFEVCSRLLMAYSELRHSR